MCGALARIAQRIKQICGVALARKVDDGRERKGWIKNAIAQRFRRPVCNVEFGKRFGVLLARLLQLGRRRLRGLERDRHITRLI